MYRKIPYVPAERQVIGSHPGFLGLSTIPTYNTPVTPRMNFSAMLDEKHPYWMPDIREAIALHPELYNDNLGRGSRKDITDAFGVKWKYEPVAGGSISVAGSPLLEDVNEWREKIRIPDIDAWDWESAVMENPVDPVFPCYISFVNGFWFERLISFMDFVPAAMALIDEEQTDALKELFNATTDLGIRLVDKICEYWPQIGLIEIHDDWGAQKAPFFSMETAYELFVPCMKRITDHIHSKGRHTMLHSCGHNKDRIQCFIDGGFDIWSPQTMNDIEAMYDDCGDKIVLSVFPKETDLAQRSEEEQREAARAFVDRFCRPGKPSIMGIETTNRGTPAFMDEVYVYSRKKYLEQD